MGEVAGTTSISLVTELLRILHDDFERPRFELFLMKRYCNEYVTAWKEIENFRALAAEERRKAADDIFVRFLHPDGSEALSLNTDLKRNSRRTKRRRRRRIKRHSL